MFPIALTDLRRAGRGGMFHSADGGDHWSHVPLEPLNMKGQIYCRDIREVPGNPRHLWVAAGAGFQSDAGALLHSRDGGDSWTQVDVGMPVPHTMFKLAFDERQPSRMSCATNGGTAGVVRRKRNHREGVVEQFLLRLLTYLIAPMRPRSYRLPERRVIEVERRHGRPRRV
jgi:hypothetical protein